ncbi:unnamed protein product [Schistosoma haematobium]|uniref:Uncharacterized protein n=1 Tax=Schistosoma haematobium TaxID=6185 RepID=A0A095A7R9_SCHHA|nr:unnamed protein product [Schistosoma haematobium]
MQLLFIYTILLLWFIHITQQVTINRRLYPQQIQFSSIPEQFIEETESVQDIKEGEHETTHRSKRLIDNQQLLTTYRNPFASLLKRKRHSKSTDSRLSIRKDFITNNDSKCGLMCHLLCRPGCSKICYSSCT